MSETFEPTLIFVGLVLCLFGWALYWAGLRVLGAACGAVIGATLGAALMILLEVEQWMGAGAGIAAAIGAVVGVYLIKRAHYLLFFMTGALLGLVIAWGAEGTYGDWLARRLPEGSLGRLLYFAAASLVGGLLVLTFHRYVVIALASFAGTALFALGIPTQYAVWIVLPLFLGSFLLQAGALAALGHAGEPRGEANDEPD